VSKFFLLPLDEFSGFHGVPPHAVDKIVQLIDFLPQFFDVP
jgi:hypothetical protein